MRRREREEEKKGEEEKKVGLGFPFHRLGRVRRAAGKTKRNDCRIWSSGLSISYT